MRAPFPPEELAVVDLTIRMFTEPTLRGDIPALAAVWQHEATRKAQLLQELNLTAEDLQSASRFCALLEAEGCVVETKPGKHGPIPAIAKTDDYMKGLLEDENDRIRTLAEARLGVRSTIDQTRSERLAGMAQRGSLPVYLGYAAAHTTRWGGGDKVNWQNFKRGGGIRKAIQAPEGHAIIKADKSQIECRLLNFIAGQWDVIERFRQGMDPYIPIASQAYGFEVTKAHQKERGTGKQLELSCGYGAGADTIVRTAAKGTYGPPVYIDFAKGLEWRDLYRSTHPAVVDLWGQGGRMIARLAGGSPMRWNVVEIREGQIILPNGCPLLYPDLEYHTEPATDTTEEKTGWRFRTRKGWAWLYGAKLVENLIQALSRIDMSQALLRLKQRVPQLKIVSLEHDALFGVAVDKDAKLVQDVIREEFCRAPSWLPGIPLDCETHVGPTF